MEDEGTQASRFYEMGGGKQGDHGGARRQVPHGGPGLSSQGRRTWRRFVRDNAAIGSEEVAFQDGRCGRGRAGRRARSQTRSCLSTGKTTEWFTCRGRSCSLMSDVFWCGALGTVVLVRPAGQETRGALQFNCCAGVRDIAQSGDCASLACSVFAVSSWVDRWD